MSRNLCRSTCVRCDYLFKLSDIRNKPIEFRQYACYSPEMGCKVACPNCNTLYFAMVRQYDKYWNLPEDAFNENQFGHKNELYGKFVQKRGNGKLIDTGCFVIDLSYYETYNDDPDNDYNEKPDYLCEDNADEYQWIWK